MSQNYDTTRNRFNPENRFIGDIEDGKRYPFACYTKEESDERYAIKSTETDLTALAAVVATKASQNDLTALAGTVSTLSTTVSGKASQSALNELANTVSTKADETECVAIRARLDALERNEIRIVSFNAVPAMCELGSSNTITCTWSLNKAATNQEINGTAVSGTVKQFTNVTAATMYTLVVEDETSSASRSTSVSFANQIYYGAAANLSNITALPKVLSDNIERTITVTAGAGQYIIYAIPARLGDAKFYVGGFEGGFEDPVEMVLGNESGFQEVYKVYRSTNANLGTTTIEVKEG